MSPNSGHVPTPTTSSAPSSAKVAPQQTSLIQAMVDANGQPVYILQAAGGGTAGPALIPLQVQQPTPAGVGSLPLSPYPHTTLTNSTFSTVTLPTSVKGGVATLQTPPPGTPKTVSGTQTFNPPSLDGLMQPKLIFNGAQQPSEAGPIRTHPRQAAKERPSPVVFDGMSRPISQYLRSNFHFSF